MSPALRSEGGGSIYVLHDASTGWSKVGLTQSGVMSRLSQCRRDYPTLENAHLIGFQNVDGAVEEWEAIIRMVVELRLRKRYGTWRGRLDGERFTGIRPLAVFRVLQMWWLAQFYQDGRFDRACESLRNRWKQQAFLP